MASAALLLVTALAVALSAGLSARTRIASYETTGTPQRVVLDVGAGNVEIVGGGRRGVEVRRTDRYSFGHAPTERRSGAERVLRISSRCPSALAGRCSSSYRLTVPDNVPLVVRTADGTVRFAGVRASATIDSGAGDVDVDTFCGFSLTIRTTSGDARTTASCSPQRLDMRSVDGDLNAAVPAGTYRVEADSDGGAREVTEIDVSNGAPFEIRALSDSGDVTVRGSG